MRGTICPRRRLISIHASLAGGDSACTVPPMPFRDFNPRLPRGRRPRACFHHAFMDTISIHASLAGGDTSYAQRLLYWLYFNPRSLAGGDGKDGWQYVRHGISIHATLAGGDVLEIIDKAPAAISIHASLAGGDAAGDRPGGHGSAFQSTPPSREAT